MWVELLVALEAFIVATTIVSSSADGKSDSGSRSEIAAAAVVEVFAHGGDIKPAFRLGEGSCKSTTCGDLFSMQLATPEKGVLLIESLIVYRGAISSRSLS